MKNILKTKCLNLNISKKFEKWFRLFLISTVSMKVGQQWINRFLTKTSIYWKFLSSNAFLKIIKIRPKKLLFKHTVFYSYISYNYSNYS